MLGFLFFDDENKSVECVYFNGLAEKVFKLINVNRYGVGVVSLLCDGRRLYFFGSDRDERVQWPCVTPRPKYRFLAARRTIFSRSSPCLTRS